MDKETLSHYGWIVILVLILAVMLALASPFGSFIAGAIKSTTAGLFNVNQAALGSAGIDVNDMVFENCDHVETEIRNATDTYTGDTCCKACGAILQAGQTVRPKVPDGGQYTAADGTVYNPGDEMPETVANGDKYTYEDYIYTYQSSIDGWHVAINTGVVSRDKHSFSAILETINSKPIKDLTQTFLSCQGITESPTIPNTVTNMSQTFRGCTALTTAPILPSDLTSLSHTFDGCSLLRTYAGSTDPDGDFSNYIIPSNVTNMTTTFLNCYKLVNAPAIPEKVSSLEETFMNCVGLKTAPDMSNANSVSNMIETFMNCTALETAPVIPSSVRNMNCTFYYCTSLKNAPDMSGANNVEVMWETFRNCTSMQNAPIIPSSVRDINYTFKNCTSMTGIISINITNLDTNAYKECFYGTEQAITITGSCSATLKSQLAGTANNGNVTVQ